MIRLTVPPEPRAVATARLFAAAAVRHFGFLEDTVEDVRIAVSEAVTNALRAHQGAGSPEAISVAVSGAQNRVMIEIADTGPGFDPAALPPRGEGEGNLGLVVIRTLFPESEVVRNSGPGMTVRLTLPLPPPAGSS